MRKIILLTVLILLISLAYSFAEVPCKINYQGRLIKDNVPVDGTKKMVFSIYNDAVAVTPPLWTSGEVDITVYNGLFRYVLDLSNIDDWTAGETLYLEVKVEDDILTPREELYAYPYAINSHLLEGATKEYFLNTSAEEQTKQGDLNIMGNVGIGTTSPKANYKLHVDGGSDPGAVGVYGETAGVLNTGVKGRATGKSGIGVRGDAPGEAGIGIRGYSAHPSSGRGVYGFAYGGVGGWFRSSTGYGLIVESGNVGIGTTEPDATLDVDGTVSIFGDWTTTDSLGNTLVKDAIYKTTTDGIVCATVMCTTNNAYINAYSGSDSSPSYPESVLTQGLPLGYSRYAAVTLPVKKDDYWRIYVLEGTPVIRWLPMGSGTCVRQ